MARSRKKTGKKTTSRKGTASKKAKPAAKTAKPQAPGDAELLTMEQAIEKLKTTRPTFYRWLRAGRIKGMKVGRQWRFRPEDIERFLRGQAPQIDLPVGADSLVGAVSDAMKKADVSDAMPSDGDNPIANAVAGMILLAMRTRASDIHIQPMREPGDSAGVAQVRLRIDGVLHAMVQFDLRLLPAVVARWKTMAACRTDITNLPQDGRIMMNVAGDPVDLRVNVAPALYGESVTVRLLHRQAVAVTLDQMPFAQRDMNVLRQAIASPCGVIVISGPTGSGKTTTLYCALKELNRPEQKVVTIEDPVEYAFPGMVQMQVNMGEGLTFERILRCAFRMDPDVIMVGEIRNHDTLELCCQAALTGHLVFTSLHTNTAAAVLTRMIDIGTDAFLVGEAMKLAVAQRLVRRLCPHCSKPTKPTASQTEQAIALARAGGVDWDTLPSDFRQPVGCPKCSQTGYRGRTVVVEMMEMTPQIAAGLKRGAREDELTSIAVGQGMTTLTADGVRRAASGETSIDEVIRVAASL